MTGVFVIAVQPAIVLAEEDHLKTVFGQKYTEYCSRVRRYIPLPAFGLSGKLPGSLSGR